MKYEYKKEHMISYSEIDRSGRLGLVNTIMLVQDMMTEYFGTFHSDNITLKRENNAVWVLTKTRINFKNIPKWEDILVGQSFTIKNRLARVELETIFKDKDGNLLITANQEACPMDISARRARRISTISYPDDMECKDAILNEEYFKLNETSFLEEDKIYSQKIMAADIDLSYHTNNVMYVRYIVDCFSSEFWSEHVIEDFEIHYISETKENDELEIYAKKINEKTIDFLIKDSEKEASRARIILK